MLYMLNDMCCDVGTSSGIWGITLGWLLGANMMPSCRLLAVAVIPSSMSRLSTSGILRSGAVPANSYTLRVAAYFTRV